MEQPNLNYIKKLSEGDVDFEDKLIAVLKKELPLEFHEFQQNFEEKQREHLEKVTRKIRKIIKY